MNNCWLTTARQPQVMIQVALACEARPLIDHYKMKRYRGSALTVYASPDRSLIVSVSGVGKLNAALTVAHGLGPLSERDHASFLNVGIAASSEFSVGECVLVNKVIDAATRQVWYPFLTQRLKASTAPVWCYDAPQAIIKNPLLDMESAGFMQAVSRLACQDQAQIIKVVSDNCAEDQIAIKPENVTAWLSDSMPVIQATIDQLLDRSAFALESHVEFEEYDSIVSRWHFTVYQQHQLKGFLRRWQIVMSKCLIWEYIDNCRDASAVLRVVDLALSKAAYYFE